MSTLARPWPNVAREARDRAAEIAVAAIRVLEPVVNGQTKMTETDRLRREAIALNSLQSIARILESVGAQTRP